VVSENTGIQMNFYQNLKKSTKRITFQKNL